MIAKTRPVRRDLAGRVLTKIKDVGDVIDARTSRRKRHARHPRRRTQVTMACASARVSTGACEPSSWTGRRRQDDRPHPAQAKTRMVTAGRAAAHPSRTSRALVRPSLEVDHFIIAPTVVGAHEALAFLSPSFHRPISRINGVDNGVDRADGGDDYRPIEQATGAPGLEDAIGHQRDRLRPICSSTERHDPP